MIFGANEAASLGKRVRELGKARALLVTDPGLVKAGVIAPIQQNLEAAGVAVWVFDRVEENPSVPTVEAAAALGQSQDVEVVIGVGGGSAMDTAKATAVLMTNAGPLTRYEGLDKFANHPMDLVLIPTTAGTGSEATFFAVITDLERHYKMPIASARLAPRFALLDPLLTLSVPPRVTAATGMDALTHALEAYTNIKVNPLADMFAREAIRIIGANLRQAYTNGRDVQARSQVLLGSFLGGTAFNLVRLGTVHAMSHPISAHFGVPHGVANAILLPYIMEFNAFACPEKFADIADLLGEPTEGLSLRDAALKAVHAVRTLNADLGIPRGLAEVGVSADAVDLLARETLTSPNAALNPRVNSEQDCRMLLQQAIHA